MIVESAKGELGTMAAVDANEAQVTHALNGTKNVWVGNLNSPTQTVISGTKQGIETALQLLGSAGMKGRPIPVACAFHSGLVAGAKAPLASGLAAIQWKQPRFPVYSNTLARPHSDDPAAIRATLVEHLVKPVRFADEIAAMYADGARIFIECGPGNVLGKLTSSILGGREHVTVQLEHAGEKRAGATRPCARSTLRSRRPVLRREDFRGSCPQPKVRCGPDQRRQARKDSR